MMESPTSPSPALVQPAEFQELPPGNGEGVLGNLDFIKDIPVRITAELGRTQLPIRDLLKLGPGAVVELKRAVGEPVDLVVNGRLLAHGEVVVVNDSFAVRLTAILHPAERMSAGMGTT